VISILNVNDIVVNTPFLYWNYTIEYRSNKSLLLFSQCHKPTPRGAVGQQTLMDLFECHNKTLTHITLAHNTISGLNSILNSLSVSNQHL